MDEKQAIVVFRDRLKAARPNAYVYKIPDGFSVAGGKRQGAKRPFDVICVLSPFTYALEFKFLGPKSTSRFQFSNLPPHQSDGLRQFAAAATLARGEIVIARQPKPRAPVTFHHMPIHWYDHLCGMEHKGVYVDELDINPFWTDNA